MMPQSRQWLIDMAVLVERLETKRPAVLWMTISGTMTCATSSSAILRRSAS